jgi:hypothetical protein
VVRGRENISRGRLARGPNPEALIPLTEVRSHAVLGGMQEAIGKGKGAEGEGEKLVTHTY